MPAVPAPIIRLDRRVPFVDAALGGRPADAAAILRAAEARHGMRVALLPVHAAAPEDGDAWYEAHLWPLLSETHLVLAGGDLLGACWGLADAAGTDRTPTWRQWGGILAEWAEGQWAPRPGGAGQAWEYIDFYSGDHLAGLVEGYAGWRDAVWRALELKEGRPPAA